jgi:polyisoprenoid-binding protein YceI
MTDPESGAAAGTITLPEPGTWTIDSMHSFVVFAVEHFTVALAQGIASGPKGTITIAPDLLASSVQASIDAATITTASAMRDERIHGPDVLDVAQYPTIDFSSSSMTETGPGRYAVNGELTMHGLTGPVTLDLTVRGVITDTWGKTRMGLAATTTIKRSDFDVLKFGHVALAAGGFMVPDALRVTLEVEATRDEQAAAQEG